MRSWLVGLLDELLFPLLKAAHPGYANRMPPYCPCDDECDLLALRELPPPQVEVWPEGEAHRFRFASSVACDCPQNGQVTGRMLQVDAAAPWVVIVPGYATGAPRDGYGTFERVQAGAVLRRGMNAALIDLPYHAGRRRPGTFSGELFFTPDLRRSVRALLQGAADTYGLVRWLAARAPTGLWGTSLGGCVAGLTAVLTPSPEAVVLMEPLDNAGDLLSRANFARPVRAALTAADLSAAQISAAFRSVAPSSYQPAVAAERLLFLTPAYDRIIPLPLQERLWRSWDEPKRMLLQEGHVTTVAHPGAVDAAVRFLAEWLLPAPS